MHLSGQEYVCVCVCPSGAYIPKISTGRQSLRELMGQPHQTGLIMMGGGDILMCRRSLTLHDSITLGAMDIMHFVSE